MSVTARNSKPEKQELRVKNIGPCKSKKPKHVLSSSSSDNSDEPSIELLKSSRLQRKVDKRLRDLSQSSHSAGKLKYKSQRGGDIDVKVRHKVHWPHEAILGGVQRQRVAYDQLSLTQ